MKKLLFAAVAACAVSVRAELPSGWTEGADVTVDTDVTLGEPTPALNSLTVADGGTLIFANWETKLTATTVTVRSGGKITCADPFLETEMSNRVWIACQDLTVEADAAIDVNERGYSRGVGTGWEGSGQGPGKGKARSYGARHGGAINDTQLPLGSLEHPEMPGSSGGNDGANATNGGHGGGVVRIEATGDVVVNGAICADAGPGKGNGGAGGAGGSVWITTGRFLSENGAVSARGGDKWGSQNNGVVNCGTGGRIAIDYDVERQRTASVSGLTISAAGGRYLNSNGTAPQSATASVLKADPGTVWIKDGQIFESLNGQGLVGKLAVPGVKIYTIDGDWTVSETLRFVEEGVSVHVTGDLVVTGPHTRFGMGGGNVVKPIIGGAAFGYVGHFSGSQAWTLTVDGDLTVADGGKIEAFPAAQPMTDETTAFGGLIDVKGALTVMENSTLELRSDMTNGASVKVCASAADIQAGGLVTAVDFGWATTKGPGCKNDQTVGGSYGGLGGRSTEQYLYGTRERPYQPGSGGGVEGYKDIRSRGATGGEIHFRVTGTLNVDGTLDASGAQLMGDGLSWTSQCCGSGGGILLDCGAFTGTGELLAKGGSLEWNRRDASHPAGGGGRISVCIGAQLWQPEMGYSALKEVSAPAEFTGTTDVSGGFVTYEKAAKVPASADKQGQPGTVGFFSVEPLDADVVWTGKAGDGLWSSAENWSGHAVPADGQKVLLLGSTDNDAVYLDSSTARLGATVLDNMTLTVTNWNTAIRAQSLKLTGRSVVRVASGTTNDTVQVTETVDGEERTWYDGASRVLIECGDLEIQSDARIDAKAKGFLCFRRGSGWNGVSGTGPGKGQGRQSGAAYGGDNLTLRGYGSAEKPEDLGSSGGYVGESWKGLHGGGAVKVVATGTVTVNGVIDASGQDDTSSNAGQTAGSGGSIYLRCKRFEGQGGVLTVRGGKLSVPNAGTPKGWGGNLQGTGGRIAVAYESLGDVTNMTFDADFSQEDALTKVNTSAANIAEPGTIWFPDDAVFTAQNGVGLVGQLIIPECTELEVAGDWTIGRPLWFAMTNLTLTVGGNLAIDGDSASLALATAHDYCGVWPARSSGRESPCALVVGGDVTVTNGGRLVVYPTRRETFASEAEAIGGTVSVAGDLSIGKDSILETPADPVTGSFVRYAVGGGLWIAEGGTVSGDELGCGSASVGGNSAGSVSRAWNATGGGHGGLGGGWTTNAQGVVTQGGTYDNAKRPYQPGVSGGFRWANSPATELSRGGGVVRLSVAGEAVVDGSITVKGRDTSNTVSCGGSGGAIVLDCLTLSGSGVLAANGGNTTNNDTGNCTEPVTKLTKLSPGGGGRIAVYEGKCLYGTPHVSRRAKSSLGAGWTGTIEALAGTFTTSKPDEILERNKPTDGTISFFDSNMSGVLLLVR